MAGYQGAENSSECLTSNEEIKQIEARYGGACRVITDIGDFSYVVDIKLPTCGLSIKFQIPAKYPAEPCHVIARSRQLEPAAVEKLVLHLTSESQRLTHSPMLQKLLATAEAWVQREHAKGANISIDTDSLEISPRSKKRQKKQKKKLEDNHVYDEKKPSMKTAEEVVNRILWDGGIPTEAFLIGYLDRFLGVVEKNFTWFSWEDLASVDMDTLAIPKHRIQYFKYKDLVVWDKTKRLDDVFGSVGGRTIYEVIQEYEANHTADEGTNQKAEHGDHSDSDSDDGIEVNVGPQESDDEAGAGAWENHTHKREEYWGQKNRPTHFLCLRITQPELIQAMEDIHDQIRDMIPEYAACILPPERLHVTLACLGLDTEQNIENAARVIQKLGKELSQMNPKDLTLEFNDVKQFFNQTLYAQVAENPPFLEFVEHLRQCVREAGIEIRDVFDYTPHMTILKLARALRRELHCPYMDGRLLESFGGRVLGKQIVDNVYLCEMSEQRSPDGFYVYESVLKF